VKHVLTLLMVAGTISAAIWIINNPAKLAAVVPGSCTLGVSGAAAKVTFTGLGAEEACRQVQVGAKGVALYRVNDWRRTETETLRCQYRYGQLEISVTDTGLGLVAIGLCSSVSSWLKP
jgi:hypothetical protein